MSALRGYSPASSQQVPWALAPTVEQSPVGPQQCGCIFHALFSEGPSPSPKIHLQNHTHVTTEKNLNIGHGEEGRRRDRETGAGKAETPFLKTKQNNNKKNLSYFLYHHLPFLLKRPHSRQGIHSMHVHTEAEDPLAGT